MPAQTHEITTPTEADTVLASESLQRLSHILGADKSDLRIHIQGDEQPGEDIALPMPAFRLLKEFLVEMAKGHGVTLLPVRAELTSQQAADLLNVSSSRTAASTFFSELIVSRIVVRRRLLPGPDSGCKPPTKVSVLGRKS